MELEHITREEFKLYNQAKENESLISRYRNFLAIYSGFAVVNSLGVAAGIAGFAFTDLPDVILGAYTLAGIIGLTGAGFVIWDNCDKIRDAKKGLEQIKSNPAYKQLY